MGRNYMVLCAACGWRVSGLRHGPADALSSLEIVLGALEEPGRSEVVELVEGGRVVSREGAFALYQCPGCHALSSHLDVRLVLTDETLYRTRFLCGLCGGPLTEMPPDRLQGAACPSCGRDALTCKALLSWD